MTEQQEKSSLQSISESYRSRGAAFREDVEDGVDTEQVQRQNHSEHAGGERSEPVEPPAASVPNTVNEGAETAAATTEAGEHQGDAELAEPETDGVGESDDDGPFPGE